MTKSIAKKNTTGSLPPAVPLAITPTFSPWTHTSDDSYIYQLSLVLATAIVSCWQHQRAIQCSNDTVLAVTVCLSIACANTAHHLCCLFGLRCRDCFGTSTLYLLCSCRSRYSNFANLYDRCYSSTLLLLLQAAAAAAAAATV